MSLKNLKKGIENKDWSIVIQAYENMTGEELSVDSQDIELEEKPVKRRGRPSKNKVVENPKKTNANKGKRKIDPRGPLVNPNRPNIFEELLPQLVNTKEDKEAREFDKKVSYTAEKTPRRESVKKIKVKCFICGAVKRIFPSEFIKLNENSRYRCNDC